MAATELLPKAWITEQWNQGYFITALAGVHLAGTQILQHDSSPKADVPTHPHMCMSMGHT